MDQKAQILLLMMMAGNLERFGVCCKIAVCVCVWGGSYNSVTVAENIFIEFYIGGPY
jgi:hypothetical protein